MRFRRRVQVVVAIGVVLAAVVAGAALVPGDQPDPSASAPASDGPGNGTTDGSDDVAAPQFREVSGTAGLNYTARARSGVIVNGGVYVTDYDGDGWPDLLAIGGSEPVLFENTGGAFERADALPTIDAPVEGAHAFDYDNDGDDDLLLLALARPPVLLENTGGSFDRRPGAVAVDLTYPVGATSADFDGDGCLDVFVIQYADWAEKRPAGAENVTVSGAEDNGNENALLWGDCRGGFSRGSDTGVSGSRWTLAASAADFTGDGRPDVHVANDFNYDLLYVNRGNGTFRQVRLGGATNRNAMASEVGDVDRDGRMDLFVTNIHLPALLRGDAEAFAGRMDGNNLLLNRGNGTFVDRAGEYGVRKGGWGWAAVLADFDNDGDQDLFHTTKRMPMTGTVQSRLVDRGTTVPEFRDEHPAIVLPRFYLRTNGSYVPLRAGAMGFDETSGTGAARLDFDNDGDLDIAVAQVDGRFRLYENTIDDGGHWLRIGLRAGADGPVTGARVSVTVDGRTHRRVVNSRADFLSQDARVVHVGVGAAERVDRVRVVWPDGSATVLRDVRADQHLVVDAGGETERESESGDGS